MRTVANETADVERFTAGALPDLLEHHPVRRGRKGLEVVHDRLVVGELENLAGREANDVGRRRHG